MNRNLSLDILKIPMAFMVVGIHSGFLGDLTLLGEYLSVNGIFRIAVPIFLIINGFYFFPALEDGRQLDWLKRVATLYFAWMLLYSYFWLPSLDFSLASAVRLSKDIIIGYLHLWYLSGMLGAALILLILRRLSSAILANTVIFLFFSGVLIQYLGNYHYFYGSALDELFNKDWLHRSMLFLSYPFFCIGYLIRKHSLNEKISLKCAGITSGVGLIALLGESYANFHQDGRDGGFDNYISLLIACPFIFILFTKIELPGSSKKNITLLNSYISNPPDLHIQHTKIHRTWRHIFNRNRDSIVCCRFILYYKNQQKDWVYSVNAKIPRSQITWRVYRVGMMPKVKNLYVCQAPDN